MPCVLVALANPPTATVRAVRVRLADRVLGQIGPGGTLIAGALVVVRNHDGYLGAVDLAILAGLILLFALRFIFMRPGPFTPISPHWAYPAALTGGAVSALFGTGGPPYVIYLSHRLRDKGSLRATLSGLFFLEGLIRIVALLLVGLLLHIQIWLPALAAIPVVVAALVTGSHIHTRLSDTQMQRLVGWLLLASALSVLFKAFQ